MANSFTPNISSIEDSHSLTLLSVLIEISWSCDSIVRSWHLRSLPLIVLNHLLDKHAIVRIATITQKMTLITRILQLRINPLRLHICTKKIKLRDLTWLVLSWPQSWISPYQAITENLIILVTSSQSFNWILSIIPNRLVATLVSAHIQQLTRIRVDVFSWEKTFYTSWDSQVILNIKLLHSTWTLTIKKTHSLNLADMMKNASKTRMAWWCSNQ